MKESEHIKKFQREFELRQKIAESNASKTQEIFTEIRKGLNAYINYGKENNRISKDYLTKYFDEIQNKIADLKDPKVICKFLLEEKGRCVAKVIAFNIRREGALGEDYQTAIDKIIVPFYTQYKSVFEFEKMHTSSKHNATDEIISNSNLPKPETHQTQLPIEIVKADTITKSNNDLQVISKSVPENIKIDIELPIGFTQIICEASKEQILNYFMILSKEKNHLNGKIYMSEVDVLEFVKNNFSVFESAPTGKSFSVNLLPKQEKTLIYFMYKFYLKYDRKLANMKMKYVMLLINNFDLFKNKNSKNILSNMSESKRPKSPKNIISIER